MANNQLLSAGKQPISKNIPERALYTLRVNIHHSQHVYTADVY